ncbi:hypothetical protein OB919_03190 [Halobacteria archaeon AArc-curdl1]|uniref:Halobacterial output domain-containing protein n=1 Tax=Natronosalvus hydrolyticus TaxID=2979988 RepID=A0AAP2Z6B1_9EURY|nr:hypothetical protein [Halobacteria archaeon AArc-curdl1]
MVSTDEPPTASSPRKRYTDSFDPAVGPVETIVDLVAEATGQSVFELPPIYDVTDPDALNALFSSPLEDGSNSQPQQFEFTFEGFRVHVTGDGQVTVVRPKHPAKITDPLE